VGEGRRTGGGNRKILARRIVVEGVEEEGWGGSGLKTGRVEKKGRGDIFLGQRCGIRSGKT